MSPSLTIIWTQSNYSKTTLDWPKRKCLLESFWYKIDLVGQSTKIPYEQRKLTKIQKCDLRPKFEFDIIFQWSYFVESEAKSFKTSTCIKMALKAFWRNLVWVKLISVRLSTKSAKIEKKKKKNREPTPKKKKE